jgi:hypothetical protein
MPQSNREQAAWRFDHTENAAPRYDAGFDCELPPDVRTELVAPKRPRILGRKTPATLKSAVNWPLYLALLIAALIVGSVALSWRQEKTVERAKTNQAISQPTPAPQPTLSPSPGPGEAQTSSAGNPLAPRAVLVQRVPRATLVKPPVPRAQSTSDLPPPVQGQQYLATMPYGLEVLATYRGQLPSEDMLPSSGNQLGDTWVVAGTPWVWIWAPGAARADWDRTGTR